MGFPLRKNANRLIAYKSADSGIPTSELVVVIKGGEPSLQGTWLHEDLALPFAQWLSPKFYIWCNDHIKELYNLMK